MNMSTLELSLLIPAFIAGLLVLATHVPLGIQVLQRGIIFIDLAIAQIAGLGVIVADLLGFEPRGIGVQLSAIIAALLGSAWLNFSEKRWPEVQEALIGVLFVLAATGSILLLAHNPHGGENLRDLLVGQILWVTHAQLAYAALVTIGIVVVQLWWRERLGRSGFYVVFACAVTLSVQLVGIYLVFASLIVPAMATRQYSTATRKTVAYSMGVLAYVMGLLLSTWLDLPTGAVVVWMLVITGAAVFFLGPKFQSNAGVDYNPWPGIETVHERSHEHSP
ncbi:MAG: metal ABC transporter permease [Gammaproteobacteria bacterium]|nr:metal ABC transporter permease [Gammaproteobacteria bacterium]